MLSHQDSSRLSCCHVHSLYTSIETKSSRLSILVPLAFKNSLLVQYVPVLFIKDKVTCVFVPNKNAAKFK